jgi:hypothetical protein
MPSLPRVTRAGQRERRALSAEHPFTLAIICGKTATCHPMRVPRGSPWDRSGTREGREYAGPGREESWVILWEEWSGDPADAVVRYLGPTSFA